MNIEERRSSFSSIDEKDFQDVFDDSLEFDFDNIFTPLPELDDHVTQIDTDSNPWVSGFPWDEEIEKANQEIFGNQEFRIK